MKKDIIYMAASGVPLQKIGRSEEPFPEFG